MYFILISRYSNIIINLRILNNNLNNFIFKLFYLNEIYVSKREKMELRFGMTLQTDLVRRNTNVQQSTHDRI